MYDVGDFVELQISEWLAESNGFDTCYLEGEIKRLTETSVLLKLVDDSEVWLPLTEVSW